MQSDRSAAVRAGVFVLLGALILIAAIIVLGQKEQIFSGQYTLISNFQNAGGLAPGAPVRLAGVSVGSVGNVSVIQGGAKKEVVRVELRVDDRYQRMIRTGSRSSIRTLGPLGDKYVEISAGSPDGAMLAEDGEIPSEPTTDFYELADSARKAFEQANQIASGMSKTLEDLRKHNFVSKVDATAEGFANLFQKIEKGPSFLHSLVYDEDAAKIVDDLKSSANVLRVTAEKVKSGQGTVGKLIYDGQTADDLADVISSLKALVEQIRNGEGIAHALVYSKEDQKAFSDAMANLTSILAKVNKAQGTLGLLVADPEVWESLKRVLGSAEESSILKYFVRKSFEAPALQSK